MNGKNREGYNLVLPAVQLLAEQDKSHKEASTMFDLPDEEILSLSKEHVFYTWSAQVKVNPIAVKRAQGVYFWEQADKRYLDLTR